MKIFFKPESNAFNNAAEEYGKIWQSDGVAIISTIEEFTTLKFKDDAVTAIIFEGISQSNPLKLRASYDLETKAATLVHELLHRISSDNMLRLPIEGEDLSLGLHKQIDLLLYDIWTNLYGEVYAKLQVQIESARTPLYEDAWNWALQFSNQDRHQKFIELCN